MRFKLLPILFFFSTAAFAQIQKQKGTLTLSNGEALSGTITHYYDKPSEVIIYGEAGAKEVLPAKQVNEIILDNGAKYAAKAYKTDEGKATMIFQVLLEAPKISLYTREENTSQYYYVSKDNNLYRLENNDVIESQGTKTYKRKDNKYIGTLSSLMSDRLDLLQELGKVRLNGKDLTAILSKYNQAEAFYYWKEDKELPKESNWAFFAQYSQFGSFKRDKAQWNSVGQMVGLQYYFSKQSRHSLKASLEYSDYTLNYEQLEMYGLGLRYELAYKKTENFNAYVLVHLAEIAYASTSKENNASTEEKLMVVARMSPGIGLEAKPLPRVAIYAEVNNLLQIDRIPKSFSLGLKYDFGKTSW